MMLLLPVNITNDIREIVTPEGERSVIVLPLEKRLWVEPMRDEVGRYTLDTAYERCQCHSRMKPHQ